MFNPNATKSVFWLIIILAIAATGAAIFLCKKNKQTTTATDIVAE